MRGLIGAALLLRSRLKSHHAAPQTASSRDAGRWSNGRLRSAWALTTHAATATGLPSTPCPLGLSVSSRCRSCSPCQDCETGERETGAPNRKSGLSACGGVTARAATCRRAEGYPIVGQPAPPFGNRYTVGWRAGEMLVKCRLVSSHSVGTVRYHSGSKGAGKKSFGPASGTGKRRGDRFLRTEIRGKRQDRRLCVKAHPAGALSCRSFLQTVRRKKAEVGRLYGGRVASGRVLALRSAQRVWSRRCPRLAEK